MEIGSRVIFIGELKMLDPRTVGILDKIFGERCVIVYPQNISHERNVKGGWDLIKEKKVQVYAHSARLSEVKLYDEHEK